MVSNYRYNIPGMFIGIEECKDISALKDFAAERNLSYNGQLTSIMGGTTYRFVSEKWPVLEVTVHLPQ